MNRTMAIKVALTTAFSTILLGSGTTLAAPRVELELITEAGSPVTATHKWNKFLGDLGIRVRIRSASRGDRIEVRQRGEGDSAVYQVTGVLTDRNTLRLPEAEFRLGDRSGLSDWLAKLREGGERRLQETEGAFGLTPTQLLAVNEALSRPIRIATKGKDAFEVLKAASPQVSLPFAADSQAQRVMADGGPVLDELQGLSAGTLMAAILRPLGLVLVPRKGEGGKVKLWITDVRNAAESWPVGWPLQKAPREVAPELFEFLQVEIADRPLSESLDAVGSRLKIPMLMDHNSLARHRIDPETTRVTLPSRRTYYLQILDRLLNQAQLKNELRVDEAGTPFLWISTLKR